MNANWQKICCCCCCRCWITACAEKWFREASAHSMGSMLVHRWTSKDPVSCNPRWRRDIGTTDDHVSSNDVFHGRKLATTAEPSILWHQLREMKSCRLRALSSECCLDFIGQSIDEISHYSSLRHCLPSSKWRVRQCAGRNSRPIAKLRYPSEPPFDVESKLCTHLIAAQPTRELMPDFTSILALPKLEKFDSA